jgi:hypothetical protein
LGRVQVLFRLPALLLTLQTRLLRAQSAWALRLAGRSALR